MGGKEEASGAEAGEGGWPDAGEFAEGGEGKEMGAEVRGEAAKVEGSGTGEAVFDGAAKRIGLAGEAMSGKEDVAEGVGREICAAVFWGEAVPLFEEEGENEVRRWEGPEEDGREEAEGKGFGDGRAGEEVAERRKGREVDWREGKGDGGVAEDAVGRALDTVQEEIADAGREEGEACDGRSVRGAGGKVKGNRGGDGSGHPRVLAPVGAEKEAQDAFIKGNGEMKGRRRRNRVDLEGKGADH
jgi:hypothetical protein